MKARQVSQSIQKAIDKSPDTQLVLEIAARAREIESKEPPREIGTSTEVVTTPNNPQCAV
jgi:DNA-directed RNA polymerase subunit K/omega